MKKLWLTRDLKSNGGGYCLWYVKVKPKLLVGTWEDNKDNINARLFDSYNYGYNINFAPFFKKNIFPKVGYGKCVELEANHEAPPE